MTGLRKTTDVIVVGGGLCGLTAAWRAHTAGASVEVLEVNDRVGGVIASVQVDGHLVERGPTSMMSSPTVDALIGELGLAGDVVLPDTVGRRRYIVRGGRLHALPTTPRALMSSRLLSWWGKARALAEPFVTRAAADAPEETLASFVRRRFGPEVLEYIVDPFVSGVYAGDVARLSSRHAMRVMHEMERVHGSVLVGALRAVRAAVSRPRMLSFLGGLEQLPASLASVLGGRVRLRERVVAMRSRGGHWEITTVGTAGTSERRARSVVLALPAHAIDGMSLPAALRLALGPVRRVTYAPVATVSLGFRRADVAHPLDGFGVLVPHAEGSSILGALFNSSLFPRRAPSGGVLLTCFLGGALAPRAATGRMLVARACEALTPLLGITGPPTMTHRAQWQRAIPQYEVGHDSVIAAASRAETEFPGLHLAGSYRSGVSLADCIALGLAAGGSAVDMTRAMAKGLSA